MTANLLDKRCNQRSYGADDFIVDLILVPCTIAVLDPLNIATFGSMQDFDGKPGWGADSSGNITPDAMKTYETITELGARMYLDKHR
jgi:hypothetical protein